MSYELWPFKFIMWHHLQEQPAAQGWMEVPMGTGMGQLRVSEFQERTDKDAVEGLTHLTTEHTLLLTAG